jgi:hypothetical protein
MVVFGAIAFVFLAIFGYAVGQLAVEPVWNATSKLEIQLTPEQLSQTTPEAWLKEQQVALLSDAVLTETVSQMSIRGVRVFGSAEQMRETLEKSLLVHSPAPGKLTLEYRAQCPDNEEKLSERIVVPLEALNSAYMGYVMAQDRKADRPSTIRFVAKAARDTHPIEDQRYLVGGMTFTGLLLIALVMALCLRWWLLRSSRVLEGQEHEVLSQLDDTDAWPELPKFKPSEGEANAERPETPV